MTQPIALIIDDEPQIRKLLRIALEAHEYTVFEAENGTAGLAEVAYRRPEIILLDLGLPDISGLEVLKRLREWSEIPVVILSVRDSESDKVTALDSGADDYVTKPFGTPELLARLRAAQRRKRSQEESPVAVFDSLTIDFMTRDVTFRGTQLKLTATEYALLALFAKHPGKIITHRQILREVWGPKSEDHREYLRVYIAHLRQKIEADPTAPRLIITEPGIGYRFTPTK